MKFLAMNTAGKNTEIAVVNGAETYVWCDPDFRRASEVLLTRTDSLLDAAGLTLGDLDFIACVTGPGSFTGIRIGVSTVRAFCYALNKPALCVTQLETLAYNERADGAESIISFTDGSNGMAYLAAYDNKRNILLAPVCMKTSEALRFLQTVDEPMAVCCDSETARLVPNAVFPDGTCAALIRAVRAKANDLCRYDSIQPLYIRVSQAERDLAQQVAKTDE